MDKTVRIDALGLEAFIEFIHDRFGLVFSECSWNDISRAVLAGMERNGLDRQQYLRFVQQDHEEMIRFISAVTITETYFFREEKQFLSILKILQTMPADQPVRCWSVTCAGGEEAYSLAMLLEESGIKEYTVYASDINRRALQKADQAVYSRNSLRSDGSRFHDLVWKYAAADEGDTFRMNQKIRDRVHFYHFNLKERSSWPEISGLDLVLFRNTLIYIPVQERDLLLNQVTDLMKPYSRLFLGSSEIPWVELETAVSRQTAAGGFYLEIRDRSGINSGGNDAI